MKAEEASWSSLKIPDMEGAKGPHVQGLPA